MIKTDRQGYRWLVWFLASSFVFYKYILEVSPGVLGKHMMAYFHTTGLGLGNLIAAYFYAYMIMQLPIGMLLDRFGPKRVISVCLFLCVLGTLLLALVPKYWLAYCARFLTGLGAAVAVLGCMKLIAIWFPRDRFAMMVGLMMTVGMLGAASGDALVQHLLNIYQWQDLVVMVACLGAILLLIFVFVVSDSNAPLARDPRHEQIEFWQGLKAVAANKHSWILSVYSGLMFAPISAFSGAWGVSFLHQARGYTLNMSAQMMSLIFYGFALGAPLFGWLSDRLQKRKVFLCLSSVVSVFSTWVIIYLPHIGPLMSGLTLFLFGFFISGFVVSFTMIREMHAVIFTATATGFMNAFNSVTSAQIDTWVGYLLDKRWRGVMVSGHRVYSQATYHYGMSLVVITLVIACLLLPFIPETSERGVS